jgi:signal transduction histidine kinase/CheY-like chemotaxis protein/HPt (histidine-containing phosphotransfer) domain-containing protein
MFAFFKRLLRQQPQTLLDLSRDLHDPRVDAVLASFKEPTVSRNRVIALLLIIVWCLFWYWRGPGEPDSTASFTQPQAVAVLPMLLSMLVASTVWWLTIRQGVYRPWMDTVGAIANFLGVAGILPLSWNLNCGVLVFLPMASITVAARYSTIPFILAIALSVAIAWFASPQAYWVTRPYFGVFTLLLLVGLPLSVHRLLQAVRVVTEAAIRARDAHSRFVATMSHELRTPLNSVLGATEMLDGETDPKKKSQLFELLSNNAMALRARVNAVLDVRSIESGRMALQIEAFTFNGILKTLAAVARPAAQAKHIDLRMDAGSTGDIVLRSDPARVEQILTNLVTNAVKFTPEYGRVELTISATGVDPQGRVLIQAIVSDNGPGIPAGTKEKIFEPFYQVSAGAKRAHEGIGLGLHIVRSMAELMQGSVTVEDNPGGGALFRWVTPMERAPATEQPSKILRFKEAVAEHRQKVRPMRVLVIDDNASNREIAQRMLQMAGHTMIAATNGEQGIRELQQGHFDLVLLDLHMPGLSGMDVLQYIRQTMAQTQSTMPPVAILSADATPIAMASAKELGAIGYLMKPLATTRLLNLLEDVSAGGALPETLDIIDVRQPTAVTEASESWLDYLRAEGNQEMVQNFIDTCFRGIELHLANLTIALGANDADQSAYHVHALKNELSQLGDKEGVVMCQRLREDVQRDPAAVDLLGFTTHTSMLKARLVASDTVLATG